MSIEAIIVKRGNGFPSEGQFIALDSELFRVVRCSGQIFTNRPGGEEHMFGAVELVDWDELGEAEPYPCALELTPDLLVLVPNGPSVALWPEATDEQLAEYRTRLERHLDDALPNVVRVELDGVTDTRVTAADSAEEWCEAARAAVDKARDDVCGSELVLWQAMLDELNGTTS